MSSKRCLSSNNIPGGNSIKPDDVLAIDHQEGSQFQGCMFIVPVKSDNPVIGGVDADMRRVAEFVWLNGDRISRVH